MSDDKMYPLMSYEQYRQENSAHLLKESTYVYYISRARAFIQAFTRSIDSEDFTYRTLEILAKSNRDDRSVEAVFDHLISRLESKASDYSSDHWRLLRKSLETYARAMGKASIANRIIWQDDNHKSKRKNPSKVCERRKLVGREMRMKKVSPEDFANIYTHFHTKSNYGSNGARQRARQVCAMLVLGYRLGIRPAEANGISVIRQDVHQSIDISIKAVKSTLAAECGHAAQRGMSREILNIENQHRLTSAKFGDIELMPLTEAIELANSFDEKRIDAIRERIRVASRSLWKNRKQQFCLYSLRYTFGSNLKAEHYQTTKPGQPHWGIKHIAALLGHRNTASISRYGNFLSGKKGNLGGMHASDATMKKVRLGLSHQRSCIRINGETRYQPGKQRRALLPISSNSAIPCVSHL